MIDQGLEKFDLSKAFVFVNVKRSLGFDCSFTLEARTLYVRTKLD